MHRRIVFLAACLGAVLGIHTLRAQELKAPLSLTVSNDGRKVVEWPLVPGLDTMQLKAGQRLDGMFPVSPLLIQKSPSGHTLSISNQLPSQFFSLRLGQMSSNALLSANLLNRIAYGPTPDELERLAAMNVEDYIEEQLAPESIATSFDDYRSAVTNGGVPLLVNTNWTFVSVTGTVSGSGSNMYIYLREAGEVSIDAVDIRYSWFLNAITNIGGVSTTNRYTNVTGNLIANGDFESPLMPAWSIFSSTHSGSYIDTSRAYSGNSSLRVVATAAGTGSGNSIGQTMAAFPVTTQGNIPGGRYTNQVQTLRCNISFAYIQNTNSRMLTVRLSQDGTVASGRDVAGPPEWIYATATGVAGTTPRLYAYLTDGAGEASIDDIKLVAGSVPEVGPNLLNNGGFESPLDTNIWRSTADFDTSYRDTNSAYSGSGSLRLVAENGGAGDNDSLYQNVAVTAGQIYTVSYWYRVPTRNRPLVVRLSTGGGGNLNSTPEATPAGLKRRLETANWSVSLDELRRWFCANAVGSRRQLLEVLSQFFENHFVTQHSKTSEYFDRYYDGLQNQVAADAEYREVSRWRQALMNENCTFYDLLKIHVESPAQIIYLDTVGSRGNANNVANENYARELFELFAMGVDNGYDQYDIVHMSRAWTGWTINIVDRSQVDDPFAPRSREYGRYPGVGFGTSVSNIIGVWTFSFDNTVHGTNRQPILSTWVPNTSATNPIANGPKRYPARFGSPWANTSYQLTIPRNRTAPQTAILDGYDVIRHLSTNLFTAEYLSVKLCRLFVHDDFVHGVYDYTDSNRSREAELVRQCIVAWMTPGQGTVAGCGNIRRVIRTILKSELFREHAATLQKVKTPLEYVASAVRVLRSVNPDGSATATTDGGNSSFRDPLSRMGGMGLFNRADPDGYPEYGAAWISAGTLAERVRFVQAMCTASGGSRADAGNNAVNPVVLLQRKLPANQLLNAGAVVDYFLSIIFPGEGKANLDQYRTEAIKFLNDGSADAVPSASTFGELAVGTADYDTRVRGVVAFLLTTQRFQEQ